MAFLRTQVRAAVCALTLAAVGPWTPAALAAAPRASSQIAGEWSGSMKLGSSDLPIKVWFTGAGNYTGRFQMVGHTTAMNPLTGISLSGNAIAFQTTSSPPINFQGTLQGNTITGTATLVGHPGPFTLTRGK